MVWHAVEPGGMGAVLEHWEGGKVRRYTDYTIRPRTRTFAIVRQGTHPVLFLRCVVCIEGSGQVCPKLDQGKRHPPWAFAVAHPCQLLGGKEWRIERAASLLGLISR